MKTDLLAFTMAIVGLLARARPLAEPAGVAVARSLDTHERAERGKLRTGPVAPDRTELDRVTAAARALIEENEAIEERIRALSERIGPMVTAQRARRGSPWHHWFRAAFDDETLDSLKAERARLQQDLLSANAPLRIALARQHRAEQAYATAVRAAERAHERELEQTEKRLAAIGRARRLLQHWPAYAYCGLRWLVGSGGRVNRAKARGWDPGPDVKPTV